MTTSAFDLLATVAARLDGDWTPDPEQPGPPGASYLGHPDGHRIGIRASGPILQTWITAGPLPDFTETGDPKKDARARTARDACLQPGRTWHLTIRTNHVPDLDQALLEVLRDRLIPALAKKPRHVLTVTYERTVRSAPKPQEPGQGRPDPETVPRTAPAAPRRRAPRTTRKGKTA